MGKLGKIAEEIKELKHGKDANIPSAVMFAFFDLVGEAFKEVDKSLDELKKANNIDVKQVSSNNLGTKVVEQTVQKTR